MLNSINSHHPPRYTRCEQTTAHRQNPVHRFYKNLWAKNSLYILKWLGDSCFRNYMTHENTIKFKFQHPWFYWNTTTLIDSCCLQLLSHCNAELSVATELHAAARHTYNSGIVITQHFKGHHTVLLQYFLIFCLLPVHTYYVKTRKMNASPGQIAGLVGVS